MALQQIFSVYDSKAFAYLPPFIFPTIEMGQRAFGEAANSESHMFSKHLDDYTLFHVGHWDDEKGTVQHLQHGHISLGSALEYVVKIQHNSDPDTHTAGLINVQEHSEPEKS